MRPRPAQPGRSSGGTGNRRPAYLLADGWLVELADRREAIPLLAVHELGGGFGGAARHLVANALAAAAACLGLEIDADAIRQGLRTFTTSYFQTPGRLNMIDYRGGRVLVDYCHNPAGMAALADFIQRLAPAHTMAMIAIPGDRRDEDIHAFGLLAGKAFDEVIVREDANTRGRERGEVAGLLRAALLEAGMDPDRVTVETNEHNAFRQALERTRPEQLTVLLVDHPATTGPN